MYYGYCFSDLNLFDLNYFMYMFLRNSEKYIYKVKMLAIDHLKVKFEHISLISVSYLIVFIYYLYLKQISLFIFFFKFHFLFKSKVIQISYLL